MPDNIYHCNDIRQNTMNMQEAIDILEEVKVSLFLRNDDNFIAVDEVLKFLESEIEYGARTDFGKEQ